MVVASPVLWLPCEHQGTKLGDSMTLEGILRRILRRILRLGDRMPKPRSMQDTGCRIQHTGYYAMVYCVSMRSPGKITGAVVQN